MKGRRHSNLEGATREGASIPSQAQKPTCEFAVSGRGEKKCRKCHVVPGNPAGAGATGYCSHNRNAASLGPSVPASHTPSTGEKGTTASCSLSTKDKELSHSKHNFLGKLGTLREREMLKDTPLRLLYLFAFYDVLGHGHFNLQVTVVLGPGIILSHSSVVAVRVCLELLLSPGEEERGDMLSVGQIRAWREQETCEQSTRSRMAGQSLCSAILRASLMLQADAQSPSLLALSRKEEGSGWQPQDTERPQPPCLLLATHTPLTAVCYNASQATDRTTDKTHDNLAELAAGWLKTPSQLTPLERRAPLPLHLPAASTVRAGAGDTVTHWRVCAVS